MANKTFAQLTAASALSGAEIYPFWQNGAAVMKTLPNNPNIRNLREYGVTAASSAASNKTALDTAISDVGDGGVVVIPDFGSSNPIHISTTITVPGPRTIIAESPQSYPTHGSKLTFDDTANSGLVIPSNVKLRGLTLEGGKHTVDVTSASAITLVEISDCFISNATRACIRAAGDFENCYFIRNYLVQTNNNTTYASGGYGFLSEDTGSGRVGYFSNSIWYENWISGGRACFYVKNDTVASPNPQNQWVNNVIYGLRADGGLLVSMALRAKFNGYNFIERMNTENNGLSAAAGERICLFMDGTTSAGFTGSGTMLMKNCALYATDTQILARGGMAAIVKDPIIGLSAGNYKGSVTIQSPAMTRITTSLYASDTGSPNLFNL